MIFKESKFLKRLIKLSTTLIYYIKNNKEIVKKAANIITKDGIQKHGKLPPLPALKNEEPIEEYKHEVTILYNLFLII